MYHKEPIKILLVEDERFTNRLIKQVLESNRFAVVATYNGNEAIAQLKAKTFDIVLTDWLMPLSSGLELSKWIRANIITPPLIVMMTALESDSARYRAIEAGADAYIIKPIDNRALPMLLMDNYNRKNSKVNKKVDLKARRITHKPPYIAVVMAVSTGGPQTLTALFGGLEKNLPAVFLVTQHGPAWMFDSMINRLHTDTGHDFNLSQDKMYPAPSKIYFAPGERHLLIDLRSYKMLYNDGPAENFVKPAADPLFRSVSQAFGKYAIAVVMSGLGSDGTMGAAAISSFGGEVLVQDPANAIAPSMPRSTIQAQIPHSKYPIEELGQKLSQAVRNMYDVYIKG